MQESHWDYMARMLKEYKMKSDAKYVMVTAISTFRQLYCIPM